MTDDVETVARLRDPRVGDSFHEMFTYRMIVVRVTKKNVFYVDTEGCEENYEKRTGKSASHDVRCEVPIDLSFKCESREDFLRRFCYSTKFDRAWVTFSRNEDVDGWFDEMLDVRPVRSPEPPWGIRA